MQKIFLFFSSLLSSHTETAAAKKDPGTKGPSAPERSRSKVQCSICKLVSQSVKELKTHFEAKHPKDTFDESTHSLPVA